MATHTKRLQRRKVLLEKRRDLVKAVENRILEVDKIYGEAEDVATDNDLSGMKTPWRYAGGKAKHIKRYLPWLKDTGRSCLVDLFVGGGSTFVGADFPRSVINDVDRAIAGFWEGVFMRREDHYDWFKKLCLEPLNHDAGDCWKEELTKIRSPWVLGAADFNLRRYSFGGAARCGKNGGRAGRRAVDPFKGGRVPTEEELFEEVMGYYRYLSKVKPNKAGAGIDSIRGRYRGRVEIHNLSYEKVPIPRDSVIFADPPYVEADKRLYRHMFKESDHRRFAEWIKGQKVPWMICYNDHPLVRELYKGFRIEEWNPAYSMVKSGRLGEEVFIFKDAHGK
jgi:site-specific DNA-adenine methylase